MMLMLKREMLTRLDDKASDSDVTVRKSDRRAAAGLKSFRDPRRCRCERLKRKEEFPLTCSRNLEHFGVECSA